MYSFECALCKTLVRHDDWEVANPLGLALFCDNHSVVEEQDGTILIDGIDRDTF